MAEGRSGAVHDRGASFDLRWLASAMPKLRSRETPRALLKTREIGKLRKNGFRNPRCACTGVYTQPSM